MDKLWEELQKEKVCGIDLDGVLSDYPNCWMKFVNETRSKNFNNLFEMKQTLSYWDYKELKQQYRNSGYKEFIAAKPYAKEFARILKENDYKIIILTARPFQEYKNLSKITTKWLEINNIEYDSVISGKDKYVKILLQFPNLRFMVEDHRSITNLVASWNYRVYLLNNEYNQGDIVQKVVRVNSLFEVLKAEELLK